MGSEHYCLRWNNHQSNLLGVFSQLLESESLVDVTLACTEGPSIRAHKVVLSACSSYFQALFLDHPNRHPIVILKDVRFAELRTLVDFMYKGEVNVEYCQLSALLKTAESLKVKGLADMTNINAAVASREEQQTQQQQQQQSQSQSQQQNLQAQQQQQSQQQQHDRSSECLLRESSREQHHRERDSIKDSNSCVGKVNERDRIEGNVQGVAAAASAGATTSSQGTKDSSAEQQQQPQQQQLQTQQQQQQQQQLQTQQQLQSQQQLQTQQQQQQQNHPQGTTSDSVEAVDMTDCPVSPTGPGSPCPGPLALDRPRRDSEDAVSFEETRGSLSPISVHSGPSDMSLSNNTTGTPGVLPLNLPQNRLPSPHSTEPLAGPSGLPPVQQVPLSLKKEMDWERSTEERSASSEISTDYRLPPDPVSLALGLDAGGWGALVERSSGHHHSGSGTGGSAGLIGHGSFASLAGLARRCGVCLATFPSAWLLERHALLQHAGQSNDDKPFTCEQCGQRYRYRSAYVKHREQNHRARLPADKLFTCDVCGMQFRYLKSFKKHRLNHALERLQRAPSDTHNAVLTASPVAERSDQVSSTGEPSQIETGSDSTTNLGDVEESRGIYSENARGEESVSETTSIQDNPGEATVEVQMTESETTARTTTTTTSSGGGGGVASGGIGIIGSVRTLASIISPSATGSEIGLNIGTSNNTTTTTDVVVDPDESVLDDGERNETPDAMMIGLARTGHEADRRERRFACPFCGKCVRSKENLKLHVRKHTGERPFVCLFCGRAFGGKSDLTRHLRIHTGERPYHCEMCGKCFARADYLSKHLTTHIHQR